jgi:AcrR family transcriptional regulator
MSHIENMTTKVDRRIVRTRQLLRRALLALVRERGFDVLTVQDIAERATVNKATFTLHYADKHDLLAQIIRDTMDEISALRPPFNPSVPGHTDPERMRLFFIELFRHVIDNADFYRAICGAGSLAGVASEIQDSIFRLGLRWVNRAGVKTWRIPPDVLMSTLTGAYMGLARWAVNQPSLPAPELLASRFMELVLPGVAAAIGEPVS